MVSRESARGKIEYVWGALALIIVIGAALTFAVHLWAWDHDLCFDAIDTHDNRPTTITDLSFSEILSGAFNRLDRFTFLGWAAYSVAVLPFLWPVFAFRNTKTRIGWIGIISVLGSILACWFFADFSRAHDCDRKGVFLDIVLLPPIIFVISVVSMVIGVQAMRVFRQHSEE